MSPPPLADWVIRQLAPQRIRNAVLGDLHEEYVRYAVAELGPTRAGLWYWKQVLAVLSHYRSPRRVLLTWAGQGVTPSVRHTALAFSAMCRGLGQSCRSLLRDRALAGAAILTLAVGIGFSATVFTVVNGVLLRPLPYDRPEELVEIGGHLPGVLGRDVAASAPEYRDYVERAASIDALAATLSLGASVTEDGRAVPVQAVLTTPNLFSLLGSSPAPGRDFAPDDVHGTLGDVAIISYQAWQDFFFGDPDAIGRTLHVDDDAITVVGIMPRDFRHPGESAERPVQLWMPMDLAEGNLLDGRGGRVLTLIGRLRDGYSIAESRAEFRAVAEELQRSYPEYYPPNSGWDVVVAPLQQQVVGQARGTLLLLLGAVVLVLLIAGANVAGLVLSRSERLLGLGGHGRRRVVRRHVGQSLVLATVGAAVAVPLAWVGTELLKLAVSAEVPRLRAVHFDSSVVFFACGASLLALLIYGVAPAVWLLTADPTRARGPATRRLSRNRLRDVLAATQVAVALVLCITAGLMVRSFQHLVHVDPGFDRDRVLTLHTRLPVPNDPRTGRFFEVDQRIAFFDRALEETQALPNVLEAGLVSHLPMRDRNGWTFGIVGEECHVRDGLPTLEFRVVSPSYFDVMNIALVEGRQLAPSDDRGAPYVITVNRALVDQYFANRGVVGQRLVLGGPDGRVAEIVGVVENVRHSALDAGPRPAAYASYGQHVGVDMTFVLKTDVRPEAIAAAAAEAVHRIDDDVPILAVASMEAVVARTVAQRRLLTWLLSLFAGLALLLAGTGMHAVMADAVDRDRPAGGPRLRADVARGRRLATALRSGLRFATLGAGAGVLGAVGVADLLDALWFQVGWLDPIVYAGGVGLLLGVALTAAFLACAARPDHHGGFARLPT